MTVLVTGAAGFIGSHVCEALCRRGETVVGLDTCEPYPTAVMEPLEYGGWDPKAANVAALSAHPSAAARRSASWRIPRAGAFRQLADGSAYLGEVPPPFHLVQADICDMAAVEQVFDSWAIDAVIHLAALAGARRSFEAPRDYIHVNVEGTGNVLEAAIRKSRARFIFASSSSVYGSGPIPPFQEAEPVGPFLSPYAATKLAAEELCRPYPAAWKASMTVLRLFTVYGPRQRPDMAIHRFARLLDLGKPIPIYGDGSALRDFTYIDDAVGAILASLSRTGEDFEIINVGSGRPATVREVLSILEAEMGRQAQISWQPAAQGDMPATHADIARARELLGYSPQVDLTEGIRRFVEWYQATAPPPPMTNDQ